MMMQPDPDRFPVDTVIPDLNQALAADGCCVLKADTGAGKSTRVPLWLLDEPWLAGKKIIMLEPRRLAASMVAERMAETLNEPVGKTVGYRMRLNTKVSADTRIEVVTEGILTRMLQQDPELTGVGLVIFDEFHERSVNADLGLAFCKEVRSGLRADLRVLVMSATIDAGPIGAYLDKAPQLVSEGRRYPVDIIYQDYAVTTPVDQLCADAVVQALSDQPEGDVLVFLPGEGEIMRCKKQLEKTLNPADTECHTLYGRMPHRDQQRAVRPSASGLRKVILATTIAESSLTIAGVRVVIDSGQTRASRFSAKTGMDGLITLPVSRASADQRAGRAGRTAPGVCYRLWTEPQHQRLQAMNDPDILMVDLAPVVLELAMWGVHELSAFDWLTAPTPQHWQRAREVLARLRALDDDGRITEQGKAIAKLPVHPRLAAMIIAADTPETKALACDIAALLSDRDILVRSTHGAVTDLVIRLDLLHGKNIPGFTLNRKALTFCQKAAKEFRRRLSCQSAVADPEQSGAILAAGFPDRIAQKRPGSTHRYLLSGGRGASLDKDDQLKKHTFLVTPILDDRDKEAVVRLAAPISDDALRDLFGHLLKAADVVEWDARHKRVSAVRRTVLDAITISEHPARSPDPQLVTQAMVQGISEIGLTGLEWTDDATRYRQRLTFLHAHNPERWPDVSDDGLLASLDTWLAPFLQGVSNVDHLKKVDVSQALRSLLDWEKQQEMDRLAPDSITVPSGANIHVDYSTPDQPALPVQVQKLFGSTTTPTVYGGAVTLRIHLLSPAGKPVQITDDLGRFWSSSYDLVRKELRGRYPKHYWPEDPVNAKPTNTTRHRRSR